MSSTMNVGYRYGSEIIYVEHDPVGYVVKMSNHNGKRIAFMGPQGTREAMQAKLDRWARKYGYAPVIIDQDGKEVRGLE